MFFVYATQSMVFCNSSLNWLGHPPRKIPFVNAVSMRCWVRTNPTTKITDSDSSSNERNTFLDSTFSSQLCMSLFLTRSTSLHSPDVFRTWRLWWTKLRTLRISPVAISFWAGWYKDRNWLESFVPTKMPWHFWLSPSSSPGLDLFWTLISRLSVGPVHSPTFFL